MGHVFKHPKYYEELRKKREEKEASSSKHKLQAVPHCDIEEAQAASLKLLKIQAASGKLQALSSKRQATSREQRAPRHLYPHKVLEASV
jgi:hypothetical protein